MTPFNNNPESSRDFTILIRSSVSLFDIISAVFPDPNISLCFPAFNPKGINTLLLFSVMGQVVYLKTFLTV